MQPRFGQPFSPADVAAVYLGRIAMDCHRTESECICTLEVRSGDVLFEQGGTVSDVGNFYCGALAAEVRLGSLPS